MIGASAEVVASLEACLPSGLLGASHEVPPRLWGLLHRPFHRRAPARNARRQARRGGLRESDRGYALRNFYRC